MILAGNVPKNKKNQSRIAFHHAYKGLAFPKKRLTAIAEQIYKAEKISSKKTIDVILCSDYFIKKLNTDYRDKPRPTDVLSFNYDEDDFIGEIYISLQRAKVQAKQFGNSYNGEISRLFVHGMFHLLGYDHETVPERNLMEAKENRY